MSEPGVELEYKSKNRMVYVKRTRDGNHVLGGGVVAEVSPGESGGEDMAKRITACLNAMEGIPTAAIVKHREEIQDHAQFMTDMFGTGERKQVGIINAKETGITERSIMAPQSERFHQITPEEVMEEIQRHGLLSKGGSSPSESGTEAPQ